MLMVSGKGCLQRVDGKCFRVEGKREENDLPFLDETQTSTPNNIFTWEKAE